MGTKQITVVIHAKPVRQLLFELWGDVPAGSYLNAKKTNPE
jgi:hypothetical protein